MFETRTFLAGVRTCPRLTLVAPARRDVCGAQQQSRSLTLMTTEGSHVVSVHDLTYQLQQPAIPDAQPCELAHTVSRLGASH